MKKFKKIVCMSACTATILGAIPFSASADDSVVYGTINIPYADFYANEGVAYEVDAVSSATTTKWASNQDGGLVQGTYNEANADGTGTILGVTYPVAISQADLEALGDNDYSFTALDSVPEAYKTVTVENGKASFSAVADDDIENSTTTVTVETSSNWGDYCVTVDSLEYERGADASSIGKLYGCIVTDTDGNNYAMRHLENIWKNELGINVLEGSTDMHGAAMSYANFEDLNGGTIDTITYITEKGYYIYDVDPDAYLPKKVTGEVVIADADVSAGQTVITSTLPSDYDAEYTLQELDGSISGNIISYSAPLAGSYSVTVSDKKGVYESLSASFTLTTDSMPAAYADGAIIKADGADEADYANFIRNIAAVTVNGTEYAASGRGSVKIINDDGTIDFNAVSKDTNVFDGSGNYTITVRATGYNQTLEFTTSSEDEQSETVTTTAATSENSASNITAATTTTTTSKGTASSPKTGVRGAAIPAVLLAAAATAAVASKKKK